MRRTAGKLQLNTKAEPEPEPEAKAKNAALSVRFAPNIRSRIDAEAERLAKETGLAVSSADVVRVLVNEALAARALAAR